MDDKKEVEDNGGELGSDEGEFLDELMHGNGTYYFSNGDM